MKKNKFLLLLLLIIQTTGGCTMESRWDKYPFNSQENAEKYALEKLKKNYGINFVFTYEYQGATFKNEFSVYDPFSKNSENASLITNILKIQKKTIFSAMVEPEENKKFAHCINSKYNIYVDSTGRFEDGCHAYFFQDKIINELLSIIDDKNLTNDINIEIVGLQRPLGTWKGTESLKKYIKARDFESYVCIYLPANKSDSEYAKQIKNILKTLYTEDAKQYNITLEVRQDDEKITFENKKGSVIFYQDLDQFDMEIDHWTEEMILDHINSDKRLNNVKLEDIYQ